MWQQTVWGFDIFDLAFYFIIYAFAGWILESGYSWAEGGHFINRGFLNGPFCPIYGFGSVLLIMMLHPWIDNLFLLFIGGVLLTSTLEYLTGLVLERLFQNKWWDYSKRRFNVQGFICLRFSLYWGIGAVIMLKLIHPEISRMVAKIPYQNGIIFIYGLTMYFMVDFIHTLRSVLELKSLLLQMHLLHMETRDRLDHIREYSLEVLDETREDIRSRSEQLLQRASAGPQRLFKAFPNLKARQYEQLYRDIRDRWTERLNGGSN